MSINCSHLFYIFKFLLVILAFLLQLLAICSSWWAEFSAETEHGKPQEKGHYGLWTLCSTKGPHWMEDCDPLDTFFQLPPYSKVAGVIGILHLLLLLLSFIPIEVIRMFQIFKNWADFAIKTKAICITEVILSFFLTVFATLIAILVSIGEQQKEYALSKSWCFWIQICIISVNTVLMVLCLFECVRFFRLELQKKIDPTGKSAETYGNPTFHADSPELSRSDHSNNGRGVAFTQSSGHPYHPNPVSNTRSQNAFSLDGTNNLNVLTYENECYQESSPSLPRTTSQRH